MRCTGSTSWPERLSCHWNAYVNCPGAAPVAGGGWIRTSALGHGGGGDRRLLQGAVEGSCARRGINGDADTRVPPGVESAAIARTISRTAAATIIGFLTEGPPFGQALAVLDVVGRLLDPLQGAFPDDMTAL